MRNERNERLAHGDLLACGSYADRLRDVHRRREMKLVRLDFGAESRELEIYAPLGRGYNEVECPFCKERNLVYYRNFARGVRCRNRECRAMLYSSTHIATRDLMPENETVLVHGLRTSITTVEKGYAPK